MKNNDKRNKKKGIVKWSIIVLLAVVLFAVSIAAITTAGFHMFDGKKTETEPPITENVESISQFEEGILPENCSWL